MFNFSLNWLLGNFFLVGRVMKFFCRFSANSREGYVIIVPWVKVLLIQWAVFNFYPWNKEFVSWLNEYCQSVEDGPNLRHITWVFMNRGMVQVLIKE